MYVVMHCDPNTKAEFNHLRTITRRNAKNNGPHPLDRRFLMSKQFLPFADLYEKNPVMISFKTLFFEKLAHCSCNDSPSRSELCGTVGSIMPQAVHV